MCEHFTPQGTDITIGLFGMDLGNEILIQANTKEGERILSCTYAIKEAVIAKEHARNGLETAIFYMDMRTFGKGFDSYYERAKEESGVRFIRSRVSEIYEVPKTKNLQIRYIENGALRSEEFDLVVLSVGFLSQEGALELAEKFGIALNEYGFCRTSEFAPVETIKEGIYVCGAFAGPKDIPETVMQASGAAGKASALLAKARGMLIKRKEYPAEMSLDGQPLGSGPLYVTAASISADTWMCRLWWHMPGHCRMWCMPKKASMPVPRICSAGSWRSSRPINWTGSLWPPVRPGRMSPCSGKL